MLKLSEAIRLGSLLVEKPTAMVWDRCAIGMAVQAVGHKNTGLHLICVVYDYWPWLRTAKATCPQCQYLMEGTAVVWHLFDSHVMENRMTIEALADWIATIEPKEETATKEESHAIAEYATAG